MSLPVAGGFALAVLVGVTGAVQAPTASAATAPQAKISVGNVSITNMNPVHVKGTLTNPSVLNGQYGRGYASWWMKPNANTALGDIWFFLTSNTDTSPTFWPGMEPLGAWHAYPDEAMNGDGQRLSQNTATFSVKQGSRLTLKITRSGRYLTMSAYATRYNDRLDYGLRGAWQSRSGNRVTFYIYSGGKWQALKAMTTGKNGWTGSYRLSSPSKRSFYASDNQTTTIWSAKSATVSR
jgi:hypothetical protein